LRSGAPITLLALAVAAWIHHLRGVDENGAAFEIQDPLAEALAHQLELAQQAAAAIADPIQAERRRIAVFSGFAPVFGDLGGEARLVEAVAQHTLSLRTQGVSSTLVALE
jgi:fructuronate reductase